ncbi:MAG: hypothetical protein O2894_04770 [Planctomycetota bacterium]|nr:hypothetical protein [Planctomycetota bacterium]
MALQLVHPDLSDERLAEFEIPVAVEALIRDCEECCQAFHARTADSPVVGFVQSDLHRAYRALAWIRRADVLTGRVFLEWGSGVGGVALLAAGLGYESSGIEVESSLVDDARALATRHDLLAEFACGSFLPAGADVSPQDFEEFAWLDTSTAPAYEELGLDLDEADLIFAYPWPGEEYVVFDLFEAYAPRGAMLLTNHGLEGLRLHRKK